MQAGCVARARNHDTAAESSSHEADETVRELLRVHGLRTTDQRLAVVRTLWQASGEQHTHLTAAQLLGRLETAEAPVDAATVYRTLSTLLGLGLVHAVGYVGHTAYQTTYGLAMRTHHHAVCTRCGAIDEIPAGTIVEAFDAVVRRTGFAPHDDAVTVYGLCTSCQ